MSGPPEHDLAHEVAQDLSPRRWTGFAVNVAANVVANLVTAGVIYAYARFTGLLKSSDTTQSLDSFALATGATCVVAMVVVIAMRRRR